MRRFLPRLAVCLIIMLTTSAGHAMNGSWGAMLVDPPVVLSNSSGRALIVKWQTSIAGVAASPVEEHVLAAGVREEHLNHANFWISEDSTTGEVRSVPNMIEVWVYAEEAPTLLLSNFRTFRNLYPADLVQRDKTVILEIDISSHMGIDIKLETFR